MSAKSRERDNKIQWAKDKMASAAKKGDASGVENIYYWAQRNKVGLYVEDAYRAARTQAEAHETVDGDRDSYSTANLYRS